MNRSRPGPLFLLACVFLSGSVWGIRRSIVQGKLDATLVSAVERDDVGSVVRALRHGANPNAHLVYQNPVRSVGDAWDWLCRDESIFWHDAPLLGQVAENGGKNDAVIMEELLDAGADVNARDMYGRTALMKAAAGARPILVRLLLRRGANRAIQSDRGKTAMTEALETGSKPVIAILRQR